MTGLILIFLVVLAYALIGWFVVIGTDCHRFPIRGRERVCFLFAFGALWLPIAITIPVISRYSRYRKMSRAEPN